MIDLSIILISRNQAWNIVRLIESVQREAANIKSSEIVLVDSASTDKTLELACAYPIKVMRLHDNQPLTPAAGRYVGYQHTNGKLLLFLDGDMELYPGWLAKATSLLEKREEVAVITGGRIDLPLKSGHNEKPAIIIPSHDEGIETDKCGGGALYRRSALLKSGTFNPYLYSDEEPDLCLRIRHNGFKIVALEHTIAFHYTELSSSLKSKISRWRRNLYLGAGQNLRYNFGKGIFWPYLRERSFGLIPILGSIVGLVALTWFLATGQFTWFGLWMLMIFLIIVGIALRKRSFYHAIVTLVERLLIADGTIRGFLIKPLGPDKYPGKYDLVK